MAKLVVLKYRTDTFFSSDGIEAQTYRTLFKGNDGYKRFGTATPLNFSDEIDTEVIEKRWILYRKRLLKVPPYIRSGIGKFLQQHYIQGDMFLDCYDFVNFIHGHIHHKFPEWPDYWELRSDHKLEVGTVMFLLNKIQGGYEFRHAALYLGHDMFASVYGAGGGLEFTNLKMMLRVYECEDAFLAVPRKNTAAD